MCYKINEEERCNAGWVTYSLTYRPVFKHYKHDEDGQS